MNDQANQLRQLVRHCGPMESPVGPPPHLLVVAGGRSGAGTTTVALNLAAAVAKQGRKTVLVDADPRGGDVAALCHLDDRHTLADVMAGQRTILDVLREGPAGVEVLPGLWGLERISDYPPMAVEHVLGQLRGLASRASLVVVDAGNGPSPLLRRLWMAADTRLVLTTPQTPDILDTYSLIKTMAGEGRPGPTLALVNQAPTAKVAEGVHERLTEACHRFLAVSIEPVGYISADSRVRDVAAKGQAMVLAAPGCTAAREVAALAAMLTESLFPVDAAESRGGVRKLAGQRLSA